MQMKCHRCDRLFTPVGSEKHCPDCIAGKPIPKKRKDVKALNESEVINYLRIGCMKWVNR